MLLYAEADTPVHDKTAQTVYKDSHGTNNTQEINNSSCKHKRLFFEQSFAIFLQFLPQKFAQAMDHEGIDEAKVRLDLILDPKEVFEHYQRDHSRLMEAVERLLVLKGYDLVLRTLKDELNYLLKSERDLKQLLGLIRQHSNEFDNSSFLDALIEILMEIALNYSFLFESFKTCQVISDLVTQNKRFPSRDLAKSYFSTISVFFRDSNQFLAYLNSLHVLNELESMEFSRKEFEFLKRCAAFKTERFPRDLFCGIKIRDVDSIVVDSLVDTAGFAYDPIWNAILSSTRLVSNDMKTVAFLLKNGISYELMGDKIKVLGGTSEGFTTTVFSIVKQYEPVLPKVENHPSEPSASVGADKSGKPEGDTLIPEERPSVESNPPHIQKAQFKNRFVVPYRQLKIINKYMPIDFEDKYYQERNERRIEHFNAMSKKFEEEKVFFMTKKDTVDDLFDQLSKVIERRHAEQRAEAEERMRLEESRIKEEQRSKMWSNLSKRSTDASSLRKEIIDGREVSESKLPTDSSKGLNESIYVPKFTTRDTFGNPTGGLYVPKFHTTNASKSDEKASESSNEKTSSCSVPWGSLRKRKSS